MSRFAIIEGGKVANIVEAEEAFAETQGWIAAQDASIGWVWDGESFSPPVKTPEEIAQEQADHAAQVEAQRAEAYRNESDPIFFKSQRGEATHQQWLDKVAEIKARFPA